ncbi:MAG: septum site-determining protein MinD, partial [Clostridia bacterium]
DLILGLTERAVFDFTDVISGRASLETALTPHPVITNLSLLSAPLGSSGVPVDVPAMRALIAQLGERFDFCIIDCPAGIGSGFRLAASVSDRAIMVCTPDYASLRDASLTRSELRRLGVLDIRLVLNRIRPQLIKRMSAVNIDDAIDKTGIRLLGIVPEDQNVMACANNGELVFSKMRTPAARAYRNIAHRVLGERIPIMKLPRKCV